MAVQKNESRIKVALATVVLAGTVLSGAGCQQRSAEATAAPQEVVVQASTIAVVEKPMPHYLVLTGSLQADEASDVAANGTGQVQKTLVERGSLVNKGDVLARIDSRGANFSQEEANAQSQVAKTQLQVATQDCARFDKLYAAGAISRGEYDRQHGNCTAAQFTAQAAEARLRTAQKMMGDTTIRAPFAGMVAERYVTAGEYVRPETKVARVVSIDPLRLELTVPEADVAQVQAGLPVDFRVAAFLDRTFNGFIRYVGPSVRTASRDLVVEAVVPNNQGGLRPGQGGLHPGQGALRPGMFATARVNLGETQQPVIPKEAVRRDGSLARIFAVVQGHAEERLAKLGEERDNLVVVEQGAKPGERVVSPVPENVVDGVKIQGS